MKRMPYVLSFRMVLFYLVTTGWIFDISLCENSINQSNENQASLRIYTFPKVVQRIKFNRDDGIRRYLILSRGRIKEQL